MKTERLRELLGAFEAAKGNKPNTRMQLAFEVMKAMPALLSRLESAERVVEAAQGVNTFDAKLLYEVSEIRSSKHDADATDVQVIKKALSHYNSVLDLSEALAAHDKDSR